MARRKKLEWWEFLVPMDKETNLEYVDRMCDQDEYHFVMKEVTNMELMTVAQGYEIAKFRYKFKPGHYAIVVVRDLVFCCYGSDFTKEVREGEE
jgi:hypothetical protein